jgi:microcompartment protein CcmL/EutN
MKQSLGFIETRGLLATIEASDVMLKAAEVHVVSKNIVGGGLVTIIIEGDVAAVKTAVEAAGAAVNRLGEALLLSTHVIARPDESLDSVLTEEAPTVSEKATDQVAAPKPPIEKSVEVEKIVTLPATEEHLVNKGTIVEDVLPEPDSVKPSQPVVQKPVAPVELPENKGLATAKVTTPTPKAITLDTVKEWLKAGKVTEAKDYFTSLRVADLRKMAKSLTNFKIEKKAIYHVSKDKLIEAFMDYVSK